MLFPQVVAEGVADSAAEQTFPTPVTVAVNESSALAVPFAALRLPTKMYPAAVPAVETDEIIESVPTAACDAAAAEFRFGMK